MWSRRVGARTFAQWSAVKMGREPSFWNRVLSKDTRLKSPPAWDHPA